MRLQGKVAIITGGGRGMGRAGALLFAKEGAKVVIADYRSDAAAEVIDEIKKAGGEATLIETNVTKGAETERMAAEAVRAYGKIDVLWNNVGGVGWRPTSGS